MGTYATIRLSSLSCVKFPTTLCVTLVGLCACSSSTRGRRRQIAGLAGANKQRNPRGDAEETRGRGVP